MAVLAPVAIRPEFFAIPGDAGQDYAADGDGSQDRYTQDPNMPIIFNLQSNYSMSNFDFSDNPGLPSNTLGRTHNSTTAGSDDVCAQGTITYVCRIKPEWPRV